MEKTTNSTQALEKLMGDTEQAIATLEHRTTTALDIEEQFAHIQKKFDEATQINDQRERDLRMKVLEAEFEQIRKEAQQEEEDLAQAVFGLNAMLESMGAEYAELGTLNEEEQALITEAENRLEEAELGRKRAETKWFFKQTAIDSAEIEIVNAKQGLEDAKTEARRRARQRLLHADIEASLQEFMLRVEGTIKIMERRMTDIERQLQSVTTRKAIAFEVKERAAHALEELDRELDVKEADLKREEELLESIESGTEEHASQTKKISNLRAEVEELRGKRNTAFILHQSKDKFAIELEIHEKTQMKLRDNQRMWITSLRSDTEERVVTFRSRLEAMKAASDQDIAKNLDDMGAEADLRNAEYMAKVGAASDRLRMEKIEKHPQRIAAIADIAAAQAEAVQHIRVREQAAIEHFKELYGIDPTASSFFHYQDLDETSESADNENIPGVF